MKKALKIAAVILAVAFAAIQFIRPDSANPPINPADTLEASASVPPDVAAILTRSCTDCHTNTTERPWYSNIAPVSWWMNRHIQDGRRSMNLSVWNTYERGKQARRLEDICEQVQTDAMPLASYRLLHPDAKLSDADKTVLCDWSSQLAEAMP